ncbi:MAG: SCP2 sterol-binding domain-containing protein [Anaerolineae bacterium]|nr:SCP2 sterol-binding domain-containing protein [Anaerolineae bacterium]
MPTADEIRGYIEGMPSMLIEEKVEGVDATIQLELSGDNGGNWWIRIQNGEAEVHEGTVDSPQMTLRSSADDLYNVFVGEANAMTAFMQGKIKVVGDMALAIKMQTWFDMGGGGGITATRG